MSFSVHSMNREFGADTRIVTGEAARDEVGESERLLIGCGTSSDERRDGGGETCPIYKYIILLRTQFLLTLLASCC